MGDKNINLSASIKVGRKPKDGKNGTSVTILSTSVQYQVSASPTEIPQSWEDSITKVKQTDAKPYLWTKTSVVYSDKNKTDTFSVSYKGKDGTNGTSFTPKGTATGFFYNMSSVPSYKDGMDSDVYIVNVDDRSNPTSELPPYVCHFEYENFIIEHAEFGDGYNAKGHLYVANSNEWVDFGEIQGAKGEKGNDGMDAINIVFSPAELVFDADENGNLKQAEKSAEVKVFRGNKQLTYLTDWDFANVDGKQPGDNCNATFMVEENSSPSKPIVKIYDISSTDIVGTKPQAKVPASSGGINVPIKVNDVTYNAYLSFAVNVNTFAHTLIEDNKQYIQKYTEVSNKYTEVSKELDNKANQSDMRKVESTIAQMPNQIKLEVYSKTSGRRNMLVNSAFRNQDSVFIHSLARIEKNTGVDGVNCIHSSDKYSGTGDGNYIGAFWDSTQKNGVVTNIPIVKGKKYVLSCWIKSDNLDLPFNIECLYMKSINQQSRDGSKSAKSETFKVTEKNKWQKISCVLDTNNADATEYLAVNFWSNNNKDVPKVTDANGKAVYPTCHAYICKPMMEEGDTYSGWTLSEDDYDYVGGNMIDNARTLEVGGSLTSINESNVSDYGLAYYGDSMSLRINNTNADSTPSIMTFTPSLEVGVDYMFSFMAKGTANIGLYALCDSSVDGDYLLSEDSVNADVREIDTLKSRYASIVLIPTQLTTEYKRYWGHMRFYGHVPTKLYLQLNHAGEVYICQPKLEEGATMTEFTERKTDLVDKASLKKAGIEITTDKVKLYGDKVEVVTTTKNEDGTSTDTQTAMFSNGKLNANLIDAQTIVVNGIQGNTIDAKNATISNLRVKNVLLSGSMRNPFSRVWDSFTNPYMDNIVMQNENSTYESVHNLPWNVEQSGRKLCIVGSLWDIEKPNTFWGPSIIEVPEEEQKYGCRFYENGIAKTKLEFSAEVLELMAYGNVSAKTDDNPKSKYIYGWIVLNRIDLMTNHQYGRQKKVLAYGKVTGTTGGASIQYKTFDGSKMSISRGDKGLNILHIPKWVYSESSLFVTLTNLSSFVSLGSIEATSDGFNINVLARGSNSFDEGSFNFEISNFDDFG